MLSIVVCARNDNYGEDFVWRLSMFMESVAETMPFAEVIIVDWGSEVPLSKVVPASFAKHYNMTRFLYVSPEQVAKHNKPGYSFHGAKALNTGIRRATGDRILCCAADAIFTGELVGYLKKFEPAPVFIPRKEIPHGVWRRHPNIWELLQYPENSHHVSIENSYYGICGGYGGLLMPMEIWHEIRGFREDYSGYGMTDIDAGFRVNMKYHHKIPATCLYEMGPSTDGGRNHKEIIRGVPSKMWVNDENWGLQGEELEWQAPEGKPLEHPIRKLSAIEHLPLATAIRTYMRESGAQTVLIEDIISDNVHLSVVAGNKAANIYGLDSFAGCENYSTLWQLSKQMRDERFAGTLFLNNKTEAFPVKYDVAIVTDEPKFQYEADKIFSRKKWTKK